MGLAGRLRWIRYSQDLADSAAEYMTASKQARLVSKESRTRGTALIPGIGIVNAVTPLDQGIRITSVASYGKA